MTIVEKAIAVRDAQMAKQITETPAPQLPAEAPPAKPPAERKPQSQLLGRNLAAALAAVTSEVGVIAKRGHNKFHGYKYATMGDVLERLTPLIGKHGLIIMQTETPEGRKMFDDGRAIAIEYEFTIGHSSGEIWPDRPRQTGMCRCRDSKGGFDDKAMNKCHTAARKYFLLALFQIATGEEDDSDEEKTGENPEKTGFRMKTVTAGKVQYPTPQQATAASHVDAPKREVTQQEGTRENLVSAGTPSPAAESASTAAGDDYFPEQPEDDADVDELPDTIAEKALEATGYLKAEEGWEPLRQWFLNSLSPEMQEKFRPVLESKWKKTANKKSEEMRQKAKER
jgi:hypothetical protein